MSARAFLPADHERIADIRVGALEECCRAQAERLAALLASKSNLDMNTFETLFNIMKTLESAGERSVRIAASVLERKP